MFVSADAFAQRSGRRPADRRQQRVVERPAQRPERTLRADMEYCLTLPALTQEQEEQIRGIRQKQLESSNKHRAKMDELRAKKRRLNIESADVAEVHGVIDEMTQLRNQQMKEGAEHRSEIRSILTEEQRAVFDRQTSMRGPVSRQSAGRGRR